MTSHDINGREYAKLSELKVGQVIEADSDFTCLKKGAAKYIIYGDVVRGSESFYIECLQGKHYLKNDNDYLVGFYS